MTARFSRAATEFTTRSADEMQQGESLRSLLAGSIEQFGPKWDVHLPVFLTAPSLARILWLDQVYRSAIDVPGRCLEFGSQWGASLNILLLLKMIHEPWNAGREIVSFSTFAQGFAGVHEADGAAVAAGDYAVSQDWRPRLEGLLGAHAQRSPIGAERNYSVIEGDVSQTLPGWLEANPEALISHAHFDMDIYAPTRDALQLVLPRMPLGAVLIFDELNCPSFPGETLAVQEVLGIHRLKLRKSSYQPYSVYCMIE